MELIKRSCFLSNTRLKIGHSRLFQEMKKFVRDLSNKNASFLCCSLNKYSWGYRVSHILTEFQIFRAEKKKDINEKRVKSISQVFDSMRRLGWYCSLNWPSQKTRGHFFSTKNSRTLFFHKTLGDNFLHKNLRRVFCTKTKTSGHFFCAKNIRERIFCTKNVASSLLAADDDFEKWSHCQSAFYLYLLKLTLKLIAYLRTSWLWPNGLCRQNFYQHFWPDDLS